MKTYTLHVPQECQPGDADGLDRAELVRDGFSWGAALFTALWFFAHRLWLAGLGVLVLVVAFDAGLAALDVEGGPAVLAHALLSVLIGLEANSLRRWTLARRGRPAVDVVAAADREAAEVKAFGRWLDREPVRHGHTHPQTHSQTHSQTHARAAPAGAPLAVPVAPYRTPDPVIGFFPEPERAR